ncbi:related to translation elongation factor HBS1 [Lecanosticta acicola]|uniref:Related to translation elongation factor HBS1 n=1 Tax=Lecanosticta acicola TaxID=111012 RepID=A0AAI8YUI5_9PEZI|nr:related to translation elongation factor HBS1 [Lecanosticta acicola]
MQRVKNIDYDEDDVYSDDDDYGEDGGGGYTQEDKDNFASLTPVVRAELDEAGVPATTAQIEEALWHYYWDVGKSVAYLKNANTTRQPQQQQQTPKKDKPKSKFDQAAAQVAQNAEKVKASQSVNGLAKKTESLKVDSAAPAKQQKINSKGLDVPKLWENERSHRKTPAAFVVIGHVDHGKSTLMGRLLLDTGAVSQRDIDKYKKQATEMGKSSFALAWVMDTGSEERERGVTVDIAQHHFTTDKVDFTILDAPGHRDFVPNMIGGASMADLAVLVVDANQLESGMKGQTREHILLAHAVGLRRVVVAVNKLDSTTPAWSESTFESVKGEIQKLLRNTGFRDADVAIVPCSGLSGENVVKTPSTGWIKDKYPTLLRQLEISAPVNTSAEAVQQPLRMQIADVFRGGITNPLSIAGRISSGNVQVGDVVVIQPSGESANIKGIETSGQAREYAFAGEIPTLHLVNIDQQHLRSGDVTCTPQKPIPVVKSAILKVKASSSLLPQKVDVHVGRLYKPGSIALVATLKDDEVLKRRPRVVKAEQMALVKLTLEDASIPLEAGTGIVLRAEGTTIAAGTVQDNS